MNNDSAEPSLQEIDDFYDGLRVVAAAAVDGAKGQEPDGVQASQPVACGLRTSDGVLHSLKSIESRKEMEQTAKRMRQTLVLLAEVTSGVVLPLEGRNG